MNIPHDEFKKIFDAEYFYDAGNLIRKKTKGNGKAGSIAGSPNHKGYIRCFFLGKLLMAHRLIFFYFNGYIPEQVDHINGNRKDNRIENLRAANNSLNQLNKTIDKRSKTGVKNVHISGKKYAVSIRVNKTTHYFGTYDTIEQAKQIADIKRAELHGDFTRS